MVIMHVLYFGLRGHSGKIADTIFVIPLFLVIWFFLCSRDSSFWWGGTLVWHLWIGRARHLGHGAASFAVEVFNVVGGLRVGIWSWTRKLIFWLLWNIG